MIPAVLDDRARDALRQRRREITTRVRHPVLLWSGQAPARNFPANAYPFRADSDFLFLAGLPLPNAVLGLEGDRTTLYCDPAPAAATLWHGPQPAPEELAAAIGADAWAPIASLPRDGAIATLPLLDPLTHAQQEARLQRHWQGAWLPQDEQLREALIAARLRVDDWGLGEIRRAIAITSAGHRAGLRATRPGVREAVVRAAIEAEFMAADCAPAYPSIVTRSGEVLHNNHYGNQLEAGDLLLVDAGAESPLGWASDLTRTWPVSGRFRPEQRDLHELVVAAQAAAIAAIAPGVEFAAVHWAACRVLAEGLVELGLLRGTVDDLLARDAHALFFPHGIGHLLGLDVHDMERHGDRAGYAPGRPRSDRFGLGYLRLNRPLAEGMVVTIEPGLYFIPALLTDPERRQRYRDCVHWERLEAFRSVRGIRIEDDVLVTSAGAEVLSAELPRTTTAMEALMQA